MKIRIDRSVRPNYPDWVAQVVHPELEDTGPKDFRDRKAFVNWIRGKHRAGLLNDHITHLSHLRDCLNLQDGKELLKYTGLIPDLFTGDEDEWGECLYLWKSVVWDNRGNLQVPIVHPDCIDWLPLEPHWVELHKPELGFGPRPS